MAAHGSSWRAGVRPPPDSDRFSRRGGMNIDYEQSGVVPFRRREGRLEILLITSLRRRRWIIPKGIVEPDMTPAQSAAMEALEEAGVKGRVETEPIGNYTVKKWGGVCGVTVFLLEVEEELDQWLEAAMRTRQWMPVDDAAAVARPGALADIIRSVPDRINPSAR